MAGRWTAERGTRPVRIANCSGYKADPGYQMHRQASLGPIDFITGDYLAEVNIAENALAYAAGTHEGWEPTAWDGLNLSIDLIWEKRIKVVINGGALNPAGLAKKCLELVREKGYDLKIAYVEGDDVLQEVKSWDFSKGLPAHLDSDNSEVHRPAHNDAILDTTAHPLVSANAYLGAREIVRGLEAGADIIICGRVSDASPVIGAAWYWYSWSETDYNKLAGALVSGHLIECSAYVTGSNFSGFDAYPLDDLYDLVFGIAEISSDGTCMITKHPNTKGMVNIDTVACQFLYELQGSVYLNSDVKAYLDSISISQVGPDRVQVTGIRGAPPPPTTKVAIFYQGGWQSEMCFCATGYATREKWDLYERMIRHGLRQEGVEDKFDVLDFQVLGTPAPNPRSQLQSTTMMRLFCETSDPKLNLLLAKVVSEYGMQHFSGFHSSRDARTAYPKPYLAMYPALYHQDGLNCAVNILGADGSVDKRIDCGHPPAYEELERRENYDTTSPMPLSSFGPTVQARLGDICLARSGDKGPNLNVGLYTHSHLGQSGWNWLRSFMSREQMRLLIGDDWRDEYFIERVEFSGIGAVHFVIYGILERGVSSSSRLDSFGKGFADYVRDKVVAVPKKFLEEVERNWGERIAVRM